MAESPAARDHERAELLAVPAWLLHAAGVALAALAGYAALQGASFNQPLVPPEQRDLAVLAILALGVPALIGRARFLTSRTGKAAGAAGLVVAYGLAAQAYPTQEGLPEFVMLTGIPWAAALVVVLAVAWLVTGLRRQAPALDQTGYEWPLITAGAVVLVLLPILHFCVGKRYDLDGTYLISLAIKLFTFTVVFLIGTGAAGRRKVGPAVHIYAVATIIVALVASVVAGSGGEEMAAVGWWALP